MAKIYIPIFAVLLLTALLSGGNSFALPAEQEDYYVNFEFPFGIGHYETAVSRNSRIQALLSVESFVHKKTDIHVRIEMPGCLDVADTEDFKVTGDVIEADFTLRTENDIWYRLITIDVLPDAVEGEYEIILRLFCDGREFIRKIPCWIAPSGYLESNIHLTRFSVPADEEGRRDLKRQENTFLIKDTSNRALRSFLLDKQTGHGFELVALEFENTGDYPVTLSLDYVILDKITGKPVDWLYNLRDEQGFDMPGIYAQTLVRPHSRELTLFKISSQDVDMAAGEYIQTLSVGLFSSEDKFIRIERPLMVKEVNVTVAFSAIFALGISLVGIAGMIMLRRFLFGGLTSREYILIGLYAAVAFSLISIPTTVIYNIFHALLGPFSFFITGIFSEIIFYILLLSLVVLLPRPGIVLCFVFAKFLLGAVILGNISVISILWYPMRAVILESALFISGLYEKDFIGMDITGYRKEINLPLKKIIWVAFVFGIADALLSFVSFNITMFFYRLFYAWWYIVAYVSISGFLYTFIAVPLGIKMGMRLKKVTVD